MMAVSRYGIPRPMVSLNLSLMRFLDFPQDSYKLNYKLISDSQLFELVKNRTKALSMSISSNGLILAIFCADRHVRIFNIKTGKLLHTIDETLLFYTS